VPACIYVTDRANPRRQFMKVAVWGANADGNVPPARRIFGFATKLKDSEGIAVDAKHDVYVLNQQPTWSVAVYGKDARGDAPPLRTISGSKTELSWSQDVAVDAARNIYVANGDDGPGPASVTVYAAGASGNVAPIRMITGTKTGLANPFGVAVDAKGYVYVSNFSRTGGSVVTFRPGANGNAAPVRTIVGSNTGLWAAAGIAIDAQGYVYVAGLGGPSSVCGIVEVFAPGASGNVAPVRVISGSNAVMNAPFGVAVDDGGRVYVANQYEQDECGAGPLITVYAAGATGNVAPIATISGSSTDLKGPAGIAVR
jgi:hypothetical protein